MPPSSDWVAFVSERGVPAALARTYPSRLQELMGYSVYRGLIGHIDKKSPAQLLNGKGSFQSIWDRGS